MTQLPSPSSQWQIQHSTNMTTMSGPTESVYSDSSCKSPTIYEPYSRDDSDSTRLPSFYDFSRQASSSFHTHRSHDQQQQQQPRNDSSIDTNELPSVYYGRSTSISDSHSKTYQPLPSVMNWSPTGPPSYNQRERHSSQQASGVSPRSPASSFYQHRYSDPSGKAQPAQVQVSPYTAPDRARPVHPSIEVNRQLPRDYSSSVVDYGKVIPFQYTPQQAFEKGSSGPVGGPLTSPDGFQPQGFSLPSSHVTERYPRYELRIRQQPHAARACGFGERDRRVIDPPPIVQLIIRDTQTGEIDMAALRCSLNTLQCTLFDEAGAMNETIMCHPDRYNTRRLMGQTVASPAMAKDEHDIEGCFFCFPDLSCRTHGRYRLRFMLIDSNPDHLFVGGLSRFVVDVMSGVFTVYSAKDFPGMRASSALTRALKLQGCNIQVKKGSERAALRHRAQDGEDDDLTPRDLT